MVLLLILLQLSESYGRKISIFAIVRIPVAVAQIVQPVITFGFLQDFRWIARFIIGFRSKHSFGEGPRLRSRLLEALKFCTDLKSSYCTSSMPPTLFQTTKFDILVQRYIFGLHQPSDIQAMAHSSYYYSRKVCPETSFLLT